MSSTEQPPPPPPQPQPQPPRSDKPPAPLTAEQRQRIEANRLRAKAILEARTRGELPQPPPSTAPKRDAPSTSTTSPGGTKRPAIAANARKGGEGAAAIKPARKFAKYVEYDLAKMTDTKAGFMAPVDEPYSVLSAENLRDKPEKMSLEEWAKHQARVKVRESKQGAYEPSISALEAPEEDKICFECGSREIDWQWKDVFNCRVCERCKKAKPEKYSLLTKTDAREDYMLTEPELKDEELLPHLEQPNPHKSTWSNMMLYVRYQVEEHAIKKWGGLEAMDAEFEKRTEEKKKRNEKKFTTKLRDLKKRTMVESWKRDRKKTAAQGRHEHKWGTAVLKADTGETIRTCEECGFELEELVF